MATSFLALILTLAGYFCVFLLTPLDLATHIRTSCDRLFLALAQPESSSTFMALPSPIAKPGLRKAIDARHLTPADFQPIM